MLLKVVLLLYTLVICFIPTTPSYYTIIITTIGTLTSVTTLGMVWFYLSSRPPLQQTMVQPLTKILIFTMTGIMLKIYIQAFLFNLFPVQSRYLFNEYPLLMCGWLNNHLSTLLFLYPLTILGASKLILLVKPFWYHSANHEFIVRVCFVVLACILVVDTVLYLIFENVYYCIQYPMEMYAVIFNMSFDRELIKNKNGGFFHGLLEKFFSGSIILIEVLVNLYILVRYKRQVMINTLNQLRDWKRIRIQTVYPRSRAREADETEMVEINISNSEHIGNNIDYIIVRPLESDRTQGETNNSNMSHDHNIVDVIANNVRTERELPNIVNSPPQLKLNNDYSAMSNRRYLLVLFLQFLSNELFYIHTRSENPQYNWAIYCFVVYTRFALYILPIIWLFMNKDISSFIAIRFSRWKETYL